jgi:hypothetical protein
MTSKTEPGPVKSWIEEHQRTPHFLRLVDRLIAQPESIRELVDIAISEDKYPFPQYASWLLLHVARRNKTLVEPFYHSIIDCILTTENPSVLRSLMGVSLCLPITDYEEGRFLDRLFSIISDPDSKPGQVYYAARKAAEFVVPYPELQREIELMLEFREEMNVSPGIVAWGKALFKTKRPSKRQNKKTS